MLIILNKGLTNVYPRKEDRGETMIDYFYWDRHDTKIKIFSVSLTDVISFLSICFSTPLSCSILHYHPNSEIKFSAEGVSFSAVELVSTKHVSPACPFI